MLDRIVLRLWHRTDISIPEGLYAGIVGIRVVVFKLWVCLATTANLQVSGSLLSQLGMSCFNSLPVFFHPLQLMVAQDV